MPDVRMPTLAAAPFHGQQRAIANPKASGGPSTRLCATGHMRACQRSRRPFGPPNPRRSAPDQLAFGPQRACQSQRQPFGPRNPRRSGGPSASVGPAHPQVGAGLTVSEQRRCDVLVLVGDIIQYRIQYRTSSTVPVPYLPAARRVPDCVCAVILRRLSASGAT